LDEAIAAHRMAIGLKPEFAEAQNDLGVALKDKGQLDEAIGAYRHAIALKPNFAEAHSNLGNALKDLGRLDEAVAAYRQAISLRPGFSIARSGLLYLLNFHTAYDAQAVAEETDRWNRQHAHPLRKFIQPHANDRSPDRRLRLGYVSADFCGHASALFIDPLLRHHDHQKFEVFCYAQMVRSDWVTRRMQTYADHWLDTRPWTDEQLAQHIRDDRIDILVDLKLHTADNRLLVFARKPAPIQVSWLGYPGSTGLETIDYRLTDPYLEPTGQTNMFPDRPYHLPNCFWCYDPMSQQPQVNSLPAIAAGHITFGSLNNFFKVTNATLDLWAKVLVAVPDSRLILLAPPGSARPRTVAYLSHRGVDPRRIEFVSRQSREEYLRTYHRIDIGLDTLPCNGHTTSMDSFWMSVPVVTLPGTAPSGRAGLSFARNLKLPDLVANDDDDFAKIAASLSADLPALAGLRASLRPLMEKSSLMDAEGFTRDIELAYRQMWRTWCETASAKS
jgi:predicted O-linked N-acetylglucosamine transferase (SPINDLY family)